MIALYERIQILLSVLTVLLFLCHPTHPSYRRAFSLVELSIVLVILGLLVGGILTGQSLIRAAELRSVTTESSQFQTAVMTFRDKYFALPGDMDNATDFWGSAGGNGSDSTCYNTVQTTTATCNGSGNGELYTSDTSPYYAEFYLFWKHLTNAGLIEGDFSGTLAANGGLTSPYTHLSTAYPGWNMPSSRLSNATWYAGTLGSANVSIQKFYGAYTSTPYADPYYINTLYLFSTSLSPLTSAGGPLSPEEAWHIDTKIDDGRPGSGKLEAFRGGSSASPWQWRHPMRCQRLHPPKSAHWPAQQSA